MTTPASPASMRTIVHPTDFSPASELAFAHALRLAETARAKFYVLHTERSITGDEIDWDTYPSVRRTLARWGLLEDGSPPQAVFERLGVTIAKVDVVDRDPVHGIVRFLNTRPCDLIVLATHGREGWDRWLRRSVAEPVVREVRVPALFLPQGARGFVDPATGEVILRRVLVPIDRAPRPESAVVEVRKLMRTLDAGTAELFLLYVGAGDDVPAVRSDDADGARVETLVRQGPVVDTIVQTARDLDVDLVAMATAGHQGFLDALRGSTTEQVVRRSERPVLAVPAA